MILMKNNNQEYYNFKKIRIKQIFLKNLIYQLKVFSLYKVIILILWIIIVYKIFLKLLILKNINCV